MALGSHLITVRRLKKYIDDVIGKKANLPDTSKTIIGNISQINSNKQNKTDSALTTTAKTVVGAINELLNKFTNYYTKTEINGKVNNITNGTCANLLNPTAQTQTKNGVTLTNNGDGTYTVNGTASGGIISFTIAILDDFSILENTKLVGCPVGGTSSTYYMCIQCYNGSTWLKTYIDYGKGVLVSNIPPEVNIIRLFLIIGNGYTANNLLFKPMITTDLNATYDDYVPYTGDSGRLNEDVARLTPVQEQIVPSANIESGTTASQAYTVGAYLVFNGKLCKVISAIAQGDTLTVGTNIEVTTSGGELKRLNSDLNGFQFHHIDVNVTSDSVGHIKLTDVPQEAFMVTANALQNINSYSTSTPMRYIGNEKWYCTLFEDTHLDTPRPNITVNIRVSWATLDSNS
jgi:hypothetical protein